VPWRDIRVGVWREDGVYVELCNINTGNTYWYGGVPRFVQTYATCAIAPREYDLEIGYYSDRWASILVFIIGPEGSNEAYIPTIDGAWYCSAFDWTPGSHYDGGGRCNASWSFVPASSSVPYFVGTNYTAGSTDGGGSPGP
jgi:hypothetical protein